MNRRRPIAIVSAVGLVVLVGALVGRALVENHRRTFAALDARVAYERGDFEEAIELFDIALEELPFDDESLRFQRAAALEKVGRGSEAEAALEDVVRTNPAVLVPPAEFEEILRRPWKQIAPMRFAAAFDGSGVADFRHDVTSTPETQHFTLLLPDGVVVAEEALDRVLSLAVEAWPKLREVRIDVVGGVEVLRLQERWIYAVNDGRLAPVVVRTLEDLGEEVVDIEDAIIRIHDQNPLIHYWTVVRRGEGGRRLEKLVELVDRADKDMICTLLEDAGVLVSYERDDHSEGWKFGREVARSLDRSLLEAILKRFQREAEPDDQREQVLCGGLTAFLALP